MEDREKAPPVMQIDDILVDFVKTQNYELLTQREVRILKDFLKSIRPVLPDALGYVYSLKKRMKLPRFPDFPDLFIRIMGEGYDDKKSRRFAIDALSDGSVSLLRLAHDLPDPEPFLASIDFLFSKGGNA